MLFCDKYALIKKEHLSKLLSVVSIIKLLKKYILQYCMRAG